MRSSTCCQIHRQGVWPRLSPPSSSPPPYLAPGAGQEQRAPANEGVEVELAECTAVAP